MSDATMALDEVLRAATRRYLHQLLLSTAGQVTEAAKIARRNRTEFYRLMGRHQIDPSLYRGIA